MLRQSTVAGSFYPAEPDVLSSQLDALLNSKRVPKPVKGIVVPHAGYVYSGAVAGAVFAEIEVPKQVILLGPNHHGVGDNVAVSGADAWATPLGNIPVADALRQQLIARIADLSIDDRAHKYEHSLEVMLPFLLRLQPDLHIVPISLGLLTLEESLHLGVALADVLQGLQDEVLLLASSDMNHFSSAAETQELDALAINAMTEYDLPRLFRVVRENQISMCGVIPAIIVMQAAYELGARSCKLIRYAHSGQVNGDQSRVVGYAGFILE
ncbi:hypothetical protein SAMN05660420_03026 [Desulfuromusa kysingii]|uniref:MEMO1 family protein SAMN05660420_03026 n=1 Tax=Desulfuromusa kysingii TaxID=37625 RepID=A0A1H4DP84_9BACT|nr:AmmeMemoRadiSam system protein B [Desulfuromusa kysingii]SEA74417.1 hypothetical protein SAMN05660420_03026 [Desulfuromusa kysingii]